MKNCRECCSNMTVFIQRAFILTSKLVYRERAKRDVYVEEKEEFLERLILVTLHVRLVGTHCGILSTTCLLSSKAGMNSISSRT